MRLVVMGTGPFAVPTFHALLDSDHEVVALYTRPARPQRGRQKQSCNPMRDVAESRNLPLLAPDDVNDQQVRFQLAEHEPELLVVCDYGQILSKDTLATARLGGINLHGSLLPKYRGAAPVNWAIYHGETHTGVTVIHMSPKLDAGPCLVKRETEIGPDETAVELENRLSQLGVEAVHKAIDLLAEWDGQSEVGQLQDPTLASKAPRLKKEDGLVDWSHDAEQISRQVRAFKPWPNTFTYWLRNAGQPFRMTLDKVSVANDSATMTEPGVVAACDGKQLLVATGQGALLLERVQPAGKRVMAIDEFLRGHRVQVGDRFGATE